MRMRDKMKRQVGIKGNVEKWRMNMRVCMREETLQHSMSLVSFKRVKVVESIFSLELPQSLQLSERPVCSIFILVKLQVSRPTKKKDMN